MAQSDKDALTGTDTTGHEWDGIKELNTPLPKWWLYTFYVCIFWAFGYFVFYPSWPWFSGYAEGVLGYSSRATLDESLEAAAADRAPWVDKINAADIEAIAGDPELLNYAMAGGKYVFADNCAPCHGAGGAGTPGYPVLADDEWIWGGTLAAIQDTITWGIRSTHEDTRVSEMPAFVADEILTRAEAVEVAGYVLSLSGRGEASEDGKTIFEENCVACHGETGTGSQELGAPNLTDGIWLYGGEKANIVAQIRSPRHGVMPTWAGRLTEAEIKQVAIYVHSLGGGQ